MFKKFVRWCLRRLMWEECCYHSFCPDCPYGTNEGVCTLLEAIGKLN